MVPRHVRLGAQRSVGTSLGGIFSEPTWMASKARSFLFEQGRRFADTLAHCAVFTLVFLNSFLRA